MEETGALPVQFGRVGKKTYRIEALREVFDIGPMFLQ